MNLVQILRGEGDPKEEIFVLLVLADDSVRLLSLQRSHDQQGLSLKNSSQAEHGRDLYLRVFYADLLLDLLTAPHLVLEALLQRKLALSYSLFEVDGFGLDVEVPAYVLQHVADLRYLLSDHFIIEEVFSFGYLVLDGI